MGADTRIRFRCRSRNVGVGTIATGRDVIGGGAVLGQNPVACGRMLATQLRNASSEGKKEGSFDPSLTTQRQDIQGSQEGTS